ncbi:HlyD family secretion protein [Pseudorhodoplanes sp.]|uniref:HlyD family secretion protein n=1 Tax=Pseudorhodoplanes sp. TaxID=1934341 RepID=UPI002D0671B0|nr:HlyD family secretion protein [Pseudorhodoplanes sp.]HWV55296.1 HlyD family secretion protein [Pseudorhodoplanes sp.]
MPDNVLRMPETREPQAKAFSLKGFVRARLRMILLVVVPLIAAVTGFTAYLYGGRYITTDNAYVVAQKVLVTPDISGKINAIYVKEGQHVAPGDPLFEIDPEPYRLALTQAKSKLASVQTDFNNLKTNLASLNRLVEFAQQNVELKQRDVERKRALVTKMAGTQADLDTAIAGLVSAQLQAQIATQQKGDTFNQLLGNADLRIEDFPAYMQAKAALDQAQRDLDHTTLRAAMGGTATQVDAIQLGRFVTAGTPVFSIIDNVTPWVEANPKETDITHLRVGQKVELDVDSFPGRAFHGTVQSVSPGTGAQFSILPAQNASGNWVKIVQRVPVRIAFDPGEDTSQLRSGMSVNVSIDTKRNRSLASLFGISSAAQEARQ